LNFEIDIEIGLQAVVPAPVAKHSPVRNPETPPFECFGGRNGSWLIDLQPFSGILPYIRSVKPALTIALQAQQTFGALPDRRSAGPFRHTRQRVGDTPQSA